MPSMSFGFHPGYQYYYPGFNMQYMQQLSAAGSTAQSPEQKPEAGSRPESRSLLDGTPSSQEALSSVTALPGLASSTGGAAGTASSEKKPAAKTQSGSLASYVTEEPMKEKSNLAQIVFAYTVHRDELDAIPGKPPVALTFPCAMHVRV